MKTLYIIGAGCSRNYEKTSSPVQGLKPPLNNDFFKMAKKIIDHYDMSNLFGPIPGLDHFIRNMNRLFGYGDSEYDTTVFLDDRLSLEEVMTHFSLEYNILNFPRSFNSNPRTNVLNELLAYTLAESLSGEVCEKHRQLARMIVQGDLVLNFNYDILMDNALRDEDKFTDSGYLMRFDYFLDEDKWKRPIYQDSPIKMLKLHGSLNWLKCINCGSILLLGKQKDVPALWTGIKDFKFNCPKCGSSKYDGLERYIIPPGVKVIQDAEMRFLWQSAIKIQPLDRILAIGYSFSDQDPQVKMLLRVMIENNNFISNIPITLVTRNSYSFNDVKERVEKIFRHSNINYIPTNDFFNL